MAAATDRFAASSYHRPTGRSRRSWRRTARASSNTPHSAATSYKIRGCTANGLPHRSLRTSGVHRPSIAVMATSRETADTPNITHPAVLGGPDANALRDVNALTPHTAAQAVPNRASAVQADSRLRSVPPGRGGPEARSRQRAAPGMSVAANVNAAIAARKNAEAHKGRPPRSRACARNAKAIAAATRAKRTPLDAAMRAG